MTFKIQVAYHQGKNIHLSTKKSNNLLCIFFSVEVKIDLFRAKNEIAIDSFDGQSGTPVQTQPDYMIVIKEVCHFK